MTDHWRRARAAKRSERGQRQSLRPNTFYLPLLFAQRDCRRLFATLQSPGFALPPPPPQAWPGHPRSCPHYQWRRGTCSRDSAPRGQANCRCLCRRRSKPALQTLCLLCCQTHPLRSHVKSPVVVAVQRSTQVRHCPALAVNRRSKDR